MRYLTFTPVESTSFDVCFLVPQLNKLEIQRHYIEPHLQGQEANILAYDLFKEGKRTKVKVQREYLADLLPILVDLQVNYLVVCDAEYFKTLTKAHNVEAALGYVEPCVVDGFEHLQVVYCPNFRSVFYDPEKVAANIRIALTALTNHQSSTYSDPGLDIIKFSEYPSTVEGIESWLKRLLAMDCDLSADIEAFSLKHYDAGIGTISFAWNKHEGIAFAIDLLDDPLDRLAVRGMLRDFFYQYHASGRIMRWHNITYDVYVLIYQLFMKDILDTKGLLEGMKILLANWDDTKLITYLATNSCAGNKLGLKIQAQEFAGNYAVEEIKDIRKIPLPELLQYNLIDSMSTWYVYEKHWNTLVADQQLEVYEDIFKPSVLDVVQMQLTGLPLDMDRVKTVRDILQEISESAVQQMNTNPLLEEFLYEFRLQWIEKENAKLKKKRRSMEEAEAKVSFNPNSNPQLQEFLFGEKHLALPVLDLTDSGNPATGGETLEKLVNHVKDPKVIEFLEALIDYKSVDKILTSFIPAFLNAIQGPDGHHYLFGFFNLGGTKSGRLSSSDPNLQNLPSNVAMKIAAALMTKFGPELEPFIHKGKLLIGKLVKSCFKAPKGWLFCGLDFASLEDRISAVTTKDPNKLKVYTDGYDGHCLRAYSYFEDRMPDIDPQSVESINSIDTKYKDERQDSKAPTFALTYQGTFRTLMMNCGFSEELAKQIETKYHELYVVSDKWVADKLAMAAQNGYVEIAFGLRLRTPLLAQTIRGTSRTPYEAEAEGRTAGNALGQSWGLLNNRAASEFMGNVRTSVYRTRIKPCAHIHDAQYYLIRDDMETLMFMNQHLVRAVQWQDHPDIWHDEVKLGGEVSVFYPDWSVEMTIPNDASREKIQGIIEKHLADLAAKS